LRLLSKFWLAFLFKIPSPDRLIIPKIFLVVAKTMNQGFAHPEFPLWLQTLIVRREGMTLERGGGMLYQHPHAAEHASIPSQAINSRDINEEVREWRMCRVGVTSATGSHRV
jgi:hypothetical protein